MKSNQEWAFLEPQNILVRMPNWLGDLVMATPILEDLRKKFPSAKITAMCQGGLGVIIQNDPHVDEILNFKKPKGLFNSKLKEGVVFQLQQARYDLGLLLTNSFSSAWLFWRGGVKNRIGFIGNLRNFLLDAAVNFPLNLKNEHLVKTYKALLEPLQIPISTTYPQLYLTELEKQEAQQVLENFNIKNTDRVIGINPGAAFGSAKCWLPERFKELTNRLIKQSSIKIIFFGDLSGASLVNEICADFSSNVINLAGKTSLRQLMSLIGVCDVFLTNDSGPMHVASALEVPLIALFGSTSDVATSPYNGGIVIHKHVACSPCYRRECPIDFRCMKEISVNEVYSEIEHLLNQSPKTLTQLRRLER